MASPCPTPHLPIQQEITRQVSLRGLRRRLTELEAMSEMERFKLSRVTWIPPLRMYYELLNPNLRQKDRVERVILYFKAAHGGDSPNWREVGKLLFIHRVTAFHYAQELLEDGRATYVAGRFVLCGVQIRHPALSRVPIDFSRARAVV